MLTLQSYIINLCNKYSRIKSPEIAFNYLTQIVCIESPFGCHGRSATLIGYRLFPGLHSISDVFPAAVREIGRMAASGG